MLKIIDQGIISRDAGRGAYMPVITRLSDGTFLASQHVGTALGSADNSLEILRSTDACKTWINEGALKGSSADDGWSDRGPAIHEIADGRLVMTAGRFENDGESNLFDALRRP